MSRRFYAVCLLTVLAMALTGCPMTSETGDDSTPTDTGQQPAGMDGGGDTTAGQPTGGDPSNGTPADTTPDGTPPPTGDLLGFPDCNNNGLDDRAEIAEGLAEDCNNNIIPDECDIRDGTSDDENENGIPDECEIDCNDNGVPDDIDIANGTSQDCNQNGIPDECDIDDGPFPDCNENRIPDVCELATNDCNSNEIPDDCDIAGGFSQDCNENGVPDSCDIADGTSDDDDGDGVPDECLNEPPTCDAGGPYEEDCDDGVVTVQLDGSGSSDPNGDTLTYLWETDCPNAEFTDANAVVTALRFDATGACDQSCTVTLTVSDGTADPVSCEATITVNDDTAPQITAPPNVTIECDQSTDPSNTGMATATDNCNPNPEIEFVDESGGTCPTTISRLWIARDGCGNSSSQLQIITVEDTTAPVLTCPADLTINCGDSTDPSNTGTATATDCDPAPTITFDDQVQGDCPQTITRTWTATDACGNNSDCTQTITLVSGNTPPSCDAGGPYLVECGDGPRMVMLDGSGSMDADEDDLTYLWSSDCADASFDDATSVTPTLTFAAADPCDTQCTVTLIVSDGVNEPVTCTANVRVADMTAPAVMCPANVTVECGESTDPSNTGSATAMDNCDPEPDVTFSDATAGSCPEVITRTWTATDQCGNSTSCSQTITLEDTTAPSIECPADVTLLCGDSTDPTNTGTATATDACDASPTVSFSDQVEGDCPQIITRTWTATDACGNSGSCPQTITLQAENAPPTCDAGGPYAAECQGATTSILLDGTGSSDPDGDDLTYMWSSDCPDAAFDEPGSPTPTLTITTGGSCELACSVTLTVSDGVNDPVSCSANVSVTDETPPTITCPDNLTIECDESSDPSNTGMPEVLDNCDPQPEVTFEDTASENCPIIIKRFWTATDACGNSATCTQAILIDDSTPPVIECPPNVTIDCRDSTDPSNTGMASATDNCDDTPTLSFSDDMQGVCPVVIARRWMAMDDCGNTGLCTQIITLDDTTPPTIECPPDVTIDCGDSTDPSNTGTATATDDCDGDPAVTFEDERSDACPYVITRTWTATDACGNASSCMQTITLEDTTPPEVECPANLTVECDESIDPSNTGMPMVSDNCDPQPDATFEDSATGTCPMLIKRIWTVTDSCGNSTQCLQVVVVDDQTPPEIDCPPDVTVACGEPIDPSNTGSAEATDNCDSSPAVTFTDSPGAGCGRVIARTWKATDTCGNISSCVQFITIGQE